MEVRITPEEEDHLAELAASLGLTREDLARDAILRLLAEDDRYRREVLEAVAQIDRGDFLEEHEMNARFERILRS